MTSTPQPDTITPIQLKALALLADPKTPASVQLELALHIQNRVTAAPAVIPEPIRLPATTPIQHISTLDQCKENLDQEEAQIEDFIRRQTVAGISAAYSLSAHMIPTQLRKTGQNSSQFITSTTISESVETVRRNESKTSRNEARPCNSGRIYKRCCLGKAA